MTGSSRHKKGSDPIYEFTLRMRIFLPLLKDRRIPSLLKLLPFVGLIFVFFPSLVFSIPFVVFFEIIGVYLFYALCSEKVVEEHLTKLRQTLPGQWKEKK